MGGFPQANLGIDTFICENEHLVLGAENFGNSFIWSTGEESRTIQIGEPGLYSVWARNECGESYDELVVSEFSIEPDCLIKTPNVFTPNGDDKNDVFKIDSDCCFVNFQLTVFNRWGKLVFEANKSTLGWDGGITQRVFMFGKLAIHGLVQNKYYIK